MSHVANHATEALLARKNEASRGGYAKADDACDMELPKTLQPPTGGGDATAGNAGTTPFELQDQQITSVQPPAAERRASPRRPYRYRQSVAPIVDNAMPAATDFFPVECRDISSAGIGFFLEWVPEFKELVMVLGTPPDVTKVICRVTQVARVVHEGRNCYLVDCCFIGRCRR